MNCLGRGNYHLFLAMVFSLGVMLSYGAYLTYLLLDHLIQESFLNDPVTLAKGHWSKGLPFSLKFEHYANAFIEDIRVGASGLLCAFTAPLAWGLLCYHIYLIWAGMTTNESFKWDEWKEDIADGYVYRCDEPRNSPPEAGKGTSEPAVSWPVSISQRLVNRASDASVRREHGIRFMDPPWRQVHSLKDIINLYDLGFWDNFLDVFRTD